MEETFKYKYEDLFNTLLIALHNLGGSGSLDEIENEVTNNLKLTEEQVNETHRGNTTKLRYRLSWAKFYLMKYGLIENSIRGIWALTEEGRKVTIVDKEIVKKKVIADDRLQKQFRDSKNIQSNEKELPIEGDEEIQKFSWQEELIDELLKIEPSAFERLCQRLLRELGFLNVEVTGRSNDGGIDGKGLLRLGAVLSFHVIFQAKRYKGSVTPSVVRDFRGAMVGRADKGLIITTGSFTREAKREATRDGATPIDLIDGNDLAEKLKELRLGIEIELVEKVKIKSEWFKSL